MVHPRGWQEVGWSGAGKLGSSPPADPTLSLSSSLCRQFLMTSPMRDMELGTACLKAGAALLAILKDRGFQNVLMISTLLPVLNHKSYVDLISPDCHAPRGGWPFHRSPALFSLRSVH